MCEVSLARSQPNERQASYAWYRGGAYLQLGEIANARRELEEAIASQTQSAQSKLKAVHDLAEEYPKVAIWCYHELLGRLDCESESATQAHKTVSVRH